MASRRDFQFEHSDTGDVHFGSWKEIVRIASSLITDKPFVVNSKLRKLTETDFRRIRLEHKLFICDYICEMCLEVQTTIYKRANDC